MKKKQNIIPKELRLGRRPRFKEVIKSNRILHKSLFKLLRCNCYVWTMMNFWKNTDKLFNCIIIETYAICNRKCSFCPVSRDSAPQKIMSNELFDKIVKELKELNYRGEIILNNFGEPLLDKRLEKFIKKIKTNLDSQVMFFTNGDFLTLERFRGLISAGVNEICISQHDEKPSEAIKNLFSEISSTELKYISYKIIKEDTPILTNYGGLVEVDTMHPLGCNPQRIIVRADGSVPLCCVDYYNEVNLGNVNQTKFIEIWNDSFYRKIRSELKRGIFNLKICKRCRGILSPQNEAKN